MSFTALAAGYLFKKYPIEAPNPEAVVAQEIERQRQQGVNLDRLVLDKQEA